jgi:putative endonuclease
MTAGRSSSPTHQVGQQAEESALRFLLNQGFQLVAQNYHCKMGEIDLIVYKNRLLVFVEVRQRKIGVFGNAAASVTVVKQRKISLTAAFFLQVRPEFDSFDCRFDVIAIDVSRRLKGEISNLNWIEGAFDAAIPY